MTGTVGDITIAEIEEAIDIHNCETSADFKKAIRELSEMMSEAQATGQCLRIIAFHTRREY